MISARYILNNKVKLNPEVSMLKNRKDHYAPEMEYQKHNGIKSLGGDDDFDPLHDFSINQLAKERIEQVKLWLSKQPDVVASMLIGSYARGSERDDSDVDFIVVVEDVDKWLTNKNWVKLFGQVISFTTEVFEDVRAVRVYYEDGLELEFGFVSKTWLQKPYVPSTQEVFDKKFVILYDKEALLKKA